MKKGKTVSSGLAISVIFMLGWGPSLASGAVIANSVADFSNVQGQDNWRYGFYNQGAPGPHGYSAVDFLEFDLFTSRREASDGLVGANNNDFLSLDQEGGHPAGIGPSGQDSIIWAVRRFESTIDGMVEIAFDLRKLNILEDRGGGITGRIFVDGVEVFTMFISNDDDTGVQGSLFQSISVGSTIDFAIDPTGMAPLNGSDGNFSARADSSHFSAIISTIPEPSASFLVAAGFGLIVFWRRSPT